MMNDAYFFILKGKTPIPVDIHEWGDWFKFSNRIVKKSTIGLFRRQVVSTVFLSINHQFGENGPPILFETMVFGGRLHGECDRYSTWDEAVAGHEAMVQKCRAH